VKVGGRWKYLFRAVDKHGRLIDFMLADRRNQRYMGWLGSVWCRFLLPLAGLPSRANPSMDLAHRYRDGRSI
jgi:hypothetical protein